MLKVIDAEHDAKATANARGAEQSGWVRCLAARTADRNFSAFRCDIAAEGAQNLARCSIIRGEGHQPPRCTEDARHGARKSPRTSEVPISTKTR